LGKHHTVLIAMVFVLIFIAGCQQAERVSVEPNKAETLVAEIDKPEPNEAEPSIIELSQTESPKLEPNEAQYILVEPNAIESDYIEPLSIEPNRVESNEACPPYHPSEVPSPSLDTLGRRVESVVRQRQVSFHGKCTDILSSFVGSDGKVDYATLRRKRLELRKLLDEFDQLDPKEYESWPESDKIAFWINTYNIQMLNIIVENYPIQASRFLSLIYGPYSIRHIKGIWTDYKFMVMDEEFTLREIQQRFFRKRFDEPRVFLALTNASISSPVLRNEPYYGYNLEEQLQDQTKRFLSGPYGFKIDRDRKTVYLSALFQSTWYGKKFVGKFGTDKKFKAQEPATRAVLNFITNYISVQDVSFLEVENYSIKYMKYDWTINER